MSVWYYNSESCWEKLVTITLQMTCAEKTTFQRVMSLPSKCTTVHVQRGHVSFIRQSRKFCTALCHDLEDKNTASVQCVRTMGLDTQNEKKNDIELNIIASHCTLYFLNIPPISIHHSSTVALIGIRACTSTLHIAILSPNRLLLH